MRAFGKRFLVAVSGTLAAALMTAMAPAGPPANDNFADRIPLTGAVVTTRGTNIGATVEAGEAVGRDYTVWWSWTAPANGDVAISTAGSGFDTYLHIYTGTDVATLVQIASDDDSGPTRTSLLGFTAVLGTEYQIRVSGFSISADEDFGHIQLLIRQGAVNDNFASAFAESAASFVTAATSVGATQEAGEPDHAGVAGSASVWWTWTAPAGGLVRVITDESTFDTLLAVYTGSDVAALTPVASNDNSLLGGTTSRVEFTASAGTSYRIAVAGPVAAAGTVFLCLGYVPNDDFANAIVVTGDVVDVLGENVGATLEAGEPAGFQSTWYRWTAPADGVYRVTDNGSVNQGSVVTVYTGTDVAALVQVGTASFNGIDALSTLNFTAVAGTEYRIRLSKTGATFNGVGFRRLRIHPVSSNAFATPVVLSGTSVRTIGYSLAFSKEAGEPNHAGDVGGASAWWSWTAPQAGRVTISTQGSSFDTVLAVYTGTDVAALTEVASADDGAPDSASLVSFDAVAGTTYRIAVDGLLHGAFALQGDIHLSISLLTEADADTVGLCGLLGLEVLIPFALLAAARRFRRAGRAPAALAFVLAFAAAAQARADEALPLSLSQDPPPAAAPAEGGDAPFLDFARSEFGAGAGLIHFSSEYEADPRFTAGISWRVPMPGLWERLGVFAQFAVASLERDIDNLEEDSGTVLLGGVGADVVVFEARETFRLLGQVGVVFGSMGDVDEVEDGAGFLLGARAELGLGGGWWLSYTPQFILGEESSWLFMHMLGIVYKL